MARNHVVRSLTFRDFTIHSQQLDNTRCKNAKVKLHPSSGGERGRSLTPILVRACLPPGPTFPYPIMPRIQDPLTTSASFIPSSPFSQTTCLTFVQRPTTILSDGHLTALLPPAEIRSAHIRAAIHHRVLSVLELPLSDSKQWLGCLRGSASWK